MRNFYVIILNFFHKMFIERSVLLNLMLLPILLIGILGTSLSAVYDAKPVKHVSIAVVYGDGSDQYRQNLVSFFENPEMNGMIHVSEATSKEIALQQLEEGKHKAVLVIPDQIDQLMHEGANVELAVLYNEKNTLEQSVISVVLSTLTDSTNALAIAYSSMPEKEGGHQYIFEPLINEQDVAGLPKTTAMNYYGVTMMVLVLVYGISFSMNNIHRDFKGNFGIRLRISPIPFATVITSLYVSGVLVSFAQASIVILFSKLVFQVYFGNYLFVVFLIALLGAMFFNAIGLLAGSFIHNRRILNLIVNFGVPVMIFIAGGYYKIDLGMFSFISPVTYIQNIFFTYIYQNEILTSYIYTILVLIAVICLISLAKLSRYKGVQVNEDI